MLALYVPLLGLATLIGMDQTEVRRWASVPFALAGLGIMSATMGRMRAQLREFNEQLEARVAERTRQLQDMIASLESFNSMVSHDLRGTLGGLSGLSAVAVQALQAGDAERAQRVMATVQRESGQMAQLVSDLLMLARLSQAEVHKQPVSLSAVVHEAMSQLSLVYGDRVQQVVPAEPLGEVLADPSLLRQALVNLVGNALKFSARVPQPQVQVRAEPRDQGVLLTVHDNGEGFDSRRQRVVPALQAPAQRHPLRGQWGGSDHRAAHCGAAWRPRLGRQCARAGRHLLGVAARLIRLSGAC